MERILCDVHGHFLPGIDDGAKDVSESLKILQKYEKDHILKAFATPHYYGFHHPTEFYKRREEAFKILKENNTTAVEIKCGAEAAYFAGMASMETELLELLKMGNSNHILLELPFDVWDPMVLDELEVFLDRGYVPIIAHLERFLPIQKGRMIHALLEMPVKIQVNAETFMEPKIRKHVLRKIPLKRIDFIGSDVHNMKERAEHLLECYNTLEEIGEEENAERLCKNSNRFFDYA